MTITIAEEEEASAALAKVQGSRRVPESVSRLMDPQAYHQIADDLKDCMITIVTYSALLTEEQLASMKAIIRRNGGTIDFTVDEVTRQYQVFRRMQEQVSDVDGNLIASASIKDVSSVIASMNSLIGLFLRAQKEIDSVKQEADLKEAVLSAIGGLDAGSQAMFFKRLEEFES